jgi:hypothetical protein
VGVDNFGSGATFNGDATDPTGTYARVFSIASGTGYAADAEVAFAAFTGLGAGFLSGMDTFHAKVYGSPLGNLEVKFIGGTDSVATIDLATYAGSTDLGNGWYDVAIPFSEFSNNAESNIDAHTGYLIGPPGDQADSTFTFYFTDTGLSVSGGSITDPGTGDNNTGGGTDPVLEDVVLYSSTAGEDHANHWVGVDNFGSGATFNGDATDPTGTYARVFSIESGTGYGPGVEVSFVAFTGLGAGFLSGMDTFHAKVYGSPLGNLEVKFIGSGTDSVATIDLASSSSSTDLGNGWYDVKIPFSEFSNNAESNIDAHTGYLIGPPGDQADSTFTFYFTDTGLSSGGSVLVDMGLITSTFISMETTNDGTVTDFFPMNDAGDYYVQLNLDAALTTSSGDSFTTFNVPLTVADSVYGSNNATTIDGTNGSDWLYGLGGNDTITGGAGDDVIQGGLGKDTLTGGDGADTFILSAAEAVSDASVADHITDYNAETDSLALDGGLKYADLTITVADGNSTVAVTATGAILAIIEGDAGLTADDFA